MKLLYLFCLPAADTYARTHGRTDVRTYILLPIVTVTLDAKAKRRGGMRKASNNVRVRREGRTGLAETPTRKKRRRTTVHGSK